MRQASSTRRRYYGWWIAGTLAITETFSYGILYYAFSVFLVPMQNDLGWSRVSLTGAFSLALLASGLAAPFAGRWLDRRGPRGLMTVGSVAATILLLCWSRVDSRPLYYLVWLGLGLTMAATLYEPAFATVATWFARDRAKALLVLTVVAGFASTIFLPLANGLIQTYGWRTAIVILAALLGIGTIPLHAFVLRRRPEDMGLLPDGATPGEPGEPLADEATTPRENVSFRAAARKLSWPSALNDDKVISHSGQNDSRLHDSSTGDKAPNWSSSGAGNERFLAAARNDKGMGQQEDQPRSAPAIGTGVSLQTAVHDPRFWWLTGAFCLATLTTVAVSVHLVPYIESRGNSAGFAAALAGSLGAFSVGGRILITIALRWLSQVQATAAVFGVQSLALIILVAVRLPAGVVLFAALFGAGNGAVTIARAGLIADLYGRTAYGAINGVVALFVTLARAIAPVGAGLAYTWAGDYDPVFAGLILLAGGAMLATLGADRAHRHQSDRAWANHQPVDRHAEGG